MGDAYPELRREEKRALEVLKQEEEGFFRTIANGMEILEKALSTGTKQIDGDTAFKLHDTFGFPVDLTADVCRERGVTVDEARFDELLDAQKKRAREAGKFKMAQGLEYSGGPTQFHGYDELAREGVKVTGVYVDGSAVASAASGDDAVIVLDHTPFYAESGGQVGDTGELRNATTRFLVEDTIKVQASVFGHHGRVAEGRVAVGDVFAAKVDAEQRAKTVRNHSSTHLMHKALREVLGEHVQQKGSLVDAERTRFDFVHNGPITDAQMRQVEKIINAEDRREGGDAGLDQIYEDRRGAEASGRDDGPVRREVSATIVRMVSTWATSVSELCGGTHLTSTGDRSACAAIISRRTAIAAGIRRIDRPDRREGASRAYLRAARRLCCKQLAEPH